MQIQLWYSKQLMRWRWSLSIEGIENIQKAGEHAVLSCAMTDIHNEVEYLMGTKFVD